MFNQALQFQESVGTCNLDLRCNIWILAYWLLLQKTCGWVLHCNVRGQIFPVHQKIAMRPLFYGIR